MRLGPQNAGEAPATAERKRAELWLWAALVASCLAPRMVMSWKLDALCNDAIFYIELAENFERGNLEAGFGRLGLNTYPPVLAILHRMEFSWESAGKIWGVLMSSLAVLPLYGWVRRQFDRRTALVAAMLYALHPKLVEWSPELLRDPTFWFLSALSLYASWRAAVEASAGWYFAAGLSIALAAHTRFEGWFLYLPLLGWSVVGLASLGPPYVAAAQKTIALRRMAGCALSAAVSPVLVLLINVAVLGNETQWQLGNFDRLEYVALWWGESSPLAPEADKNARERHAVARIATDSEPRVAGPSEAIATPAVARMSIGKMLEVYGNTLRRGFGGLFGVAWLIGFALGRKRWLRADHAILVLVAALIGMAAWIHFWYAQATSSRYFLTIVMLACPCGATGWLWVYDGFMRLVYRVGLRHNRMKVVTGVTAVLATLLAGVGESLADRHDGRSREAALGRWLLSELGPARQIATVTPMPLIGFYARTTTSIVPLDQGALEAGPEKPLDAIVALSRRANGQALARLAASARQCGFEPVDRRQLPAGHSWNDILVLINRSRRSVLP